MSSDARIVIYDNNKIVKASNRQLNLKDFVRSIQEFQMFANEMLSQVIEDACQGGDTYENDMDQEDESNDEEDFNITPKKRRQ